MLCEFSLHSLRFCLLVSLRQEGTYAELLENSGAFADFLQTYGSEETSGRCLLYLNFFFFVVRREIRTFFALCSGKEGLVHVTNFFSV